MARGRFAVIACAAGLVAAGCSSGPKTDRANSTTARAGAPNIVLIVTDDETASDLALMPNVKSLLADRGVTFSNYIDTSSAGASRATILRGQYAHSTGVLSSGSDNGGFGKFVENGLEDSNVATWLKGGGYRTGLFGEYLPGYPSAANGVRGGKNTTLPNTYVPVGWTDWAAATKNGANGFDYDLNINGKVKHFGSGSKDHLIDVITTQFTGFVDGATKEKRPFFAMVSPFAPHAPANAPARDAKLFPTAQAPRGAAFDEADVKDKPKFIQALGRISDSDAKAIDQLYRKRLQDLQAVDEMVATIVSKLDDSKQLADTYLVFTSDNGFLQGQHRVQTGKDVPYDPSIRVPLLVRGPAVPAGRTLDHLVANVDLAPTIAELTGVRASDYVDGRSLAPLLVDSPPASQSWRQSLPIEHWPTRDDVEGDRFNNLPEYHGVRTLTATYVQYADGEKELYDLRADPDELTNLASSAAKSTLDAYANLTGQLSSCKTDGCRSAEDQQAPTLGPS